MAEAVPNHYQRLGVHPRADATDLRSAYLGLVRLLHPDLQANLPAAEARLVERRMREVNESFAVLRDPASRRDYDDHLQGLGLLDGRGRPRPMKPPWATADT